LWPDIYDLLKPAAEYGRVTIPEAGDTFWIAFEGPTIFGACVTCLCGDEAQVKAIAGYRLKDWLGDLDEAVSGWARSSGAQKLTALGRKGWRRYFRRFGWGLCGEENGRLRFEKEL